MAAALDVKFRLEVTYNVELSERVPYNTTSVELELSSVCKALKFTKKPHPHALPALSGTSSPFHMMDDDLKAYEDARVKELQ